MDAQVRLPADCVAASPPRAEQVVRRQYELEHARGAISRNVVVPLRLFGSRHGAKEQHGETEQNGRRSHMGAFTDVTDASCRSMISRALRR
jgi:hypothetical protein